MNSKEPWPASACRQISASRESCRGLAGGALPREARLGDYRYPAMR